MTTFEKKVAYILGKLEEAYLEDRIRLVAHQSGNSFPVLELQGNASLSVTIRKLDDREVVQTESPERLPEFFYEGVVCFNENDHAAFVDQVRSYMRRVLERSLARLDEGMVKEGLADHAKRMRERYWTKVKESKHEVLSLKEDGNTDDTAALQLLVNEVCKPEPKLPRGGFF